MAARAGEGHGEASIDAQGNPGRVGWNPSGDDTHGSAHVVTPANALSWCMRTPITPTLKSVNPVREAHLSAPEIRQIRLGRTTFEVDFEVHDGEVGG